MSELPFGWISIPLDAVSNLIRGVTYKKDESADHPEEGYLPVLRANNIQNGKLQFDDLVFVLEQNIKDIQKIRKGDIVVAMSSGSKRLVGKCGIAKTDFNGGFGAFCGVLRPSQYINSKYVGLYTQTKEYSDLISSLSKGVNINNLKPDHFSEIKIPLAPLNEQIRIADKLDSVLAKVDAAQARLEKIPTLLKRFRQSVLAAATSGELTREWRERNVEARSHHDSYDGQFQLSEETLTKYDVPDSWQWVALGNYAKCNRGKFSIRPRNDPSCFEGEYPFIQIGDLPKDGGFVSTHNQTLNEKGLSVSKMFEAGTVVIAIVGATIANTGILKYPMCFPDSLVGIKSPSETGNIYVDYYLRANKENIRQVSYAGGGQPNIKLTVLNPLPLPLPPAEEQKEIVRRVESLFAQADAVEKQYLAAKQRLDRLSQALLAKAFRGELVPQDPNDEPAAELLKRIQAERLAQQPIKLKRSKPA